MWHETALSDNRGGTDEYSDVGWFGVQPLPGCFICVTLHTSGQVSFVKRERILYFLNPS